MSWLALLLLLLALAGLVLAVLLLRARKARQAQSILAGVYGLLVSDQEQLSGYSFLLSNLKDNTISRQTGDLYGLSPNNPIRANGPIGELVYISRLMTQTGHGFIGHRLGSIGGLDVFEVVSTDFKIWLVLWFDMYWTTKDVCAPAGLQLADAHGPWPDVLAVGLSASNRFMPRFPDRYWSDSLWATTELIGFPLVKPGLMHLDASGIKRPDAHSRLMKHVVVMARAQGVDDDS